MCDPVSLAVASTGMQAYSSIQAGRAEANIANANARLAAEQANEVERLKAQQLTDIQQQKQQVIGTQRAAMAGAGVDSGYGSGLDILSNTAFLAQQDMNNTEINAANEKWGYQQQAANYKAQAGAAKAAGYNNALGAVLAGAGKVSSMQDVQPSTNAGSSSPFAPTTYKEAKASWQQNANFNFVAPRWRKMTFTGG